MSVHFLLQFLGFYFSKEKYVSNKNKIYTARNLLIIHIILMIYFEIYFRPNK